MIYLSEIIAWEDMSEEEQVEKIREIDPDFDGIITNWTDTDEEHAEKIQKLFPNGVDIGVQEINRVEVDDDYMAELLYELNK